MNLTVENLGPIKKGKIDLNKSLTILTGANNAGKSYLTYLIYGVSQYGELSDLVSNIRDISNLFIQSNESENAIKLEHSPVIIIRDFINKNRLKLESYLNNLVAKNFQKIFASSLINPNVEISLHPEYIDVITDDERNIKVSGDKIYWVSNSGKLEEVELTYINDTDKFPAVIDKVIHVLALITSVGLEAEVNKRSYFFPAERTAINLFAKHITATKAEIKDEFDSEALTSLSDEELGRRLRAQVRTAPKYPYAIRDYINFVNNFKPNEKLGVYAPIAADMETALAGGSLHLDKYEQLNFTPTDSEIPLELHLSSSLVKSLSYLILYLRYSAKEGDQIIIDEPELNLHPDLQISFAKIIAQMVNAGLKIIISTHSDYLLKEINNLILLHKVPESENKTAFLATHNYSQEYLLDSKHVDAYYLSEHTIIPINVEKNGIEVPSINEAMTSIDSMAQEIFFRLEE